MISRIIIYYLIMINLISMLLMWIDKRKARKGKYRISEKMLLTPGLLGGIFGILIGMKLFHHKTRKNSFRIPAFILLALNLIIIYWLLM